MMHGQRSDVVLPADFGAGAELPTVQQNHGITMAGLEILESQRFRYTIMSAVRAAAERARALGKEG